MRSGQGLGSALGVVVCIYVDDIAARSPTLVCGCGRVSQQGTDVCTFGLFARFAHP